VTPEQKYRQIDMRIELIPPLISVRYFSRLVLTLWN